MPEQEDLQNVAFYYPGHLWRSPRWIKTLLLFFDGVGLLIPEYKQGEPEAVDPVLAGPLSDQGLLHYLVADEVVDEDATRKLTTALAQVIESGALDALRQDGSAFHQLSMSRMGYYGERALAESLFQELKTRGLASDSEDGASVPMHPTVRYLILVLLAQILRPYGPRIGLDLAPATDQFRIVRALTEFLEMPEVHSAGSVIAFDLQHVSVDLSAIPLDEVLSFRGEFREMHRRYVRSARAFARELSQMPEFDRAAAFRGRQAELDDYANELRKTARRAWKQPACFALGLTGASWHYVTGDPIGAVLAAASALLGASNTVQTVDAFSYVFAAHERYV